MVEILKNLSENPVLFFGIVVFALFAIIVVSVSISKFTTGKIKTENLDVEMENEKANINSPKVNLKDSQNSITAFHSKIAVTTNDLKANTNTDNNQNQQSIEDLMKQTIEKLDNCSKYFQSKTIIDKIIKEHCNQLKMYLQNYNQPTIKISTQELYDSIDEVFDSYNKIKIIDQDINRWDELVLGHDNFYYSKKIIDYSVENSENPKFCLERIFILTDEDMKNIQKVISILKRIEELSKKAIQDRLKIFIYEVGKKTRLDNKLRTHDDFILATKDNDTIILKEDFNYSSRRPPSETKAYLSITDKNNELSHFFQAMLDSTHLIDYKKFIKQYDN